ncbi:hypothetical protein LCGC14_2200840, partial [marine sediment metagenome]
MCSSEKIIPSNENEEKVQQHENIDKSKKDAFLRNYPGWNSSNIDKGIIDINNEFCLIGEYHPVISLINAVRYKQG